MCFTFNSFCNSLIYLWPPWGGLSSHHRDICKYPNSRRNFPVLEPWFPDNEFQTRLNWWPSISLTPLEPPSRPKCIAAPPLFRRALLWYWESELNGSRFWLRYGYRANMDNRPLPTIPSRLLQQIKGRCEGRRSCFKCDGLGPGGIVKKGGTRLREFPLVDHATYPKPIFLCLL